MSLSRLVATHVKNDQLLFIQCLLYVMRWRVLFIKIYSVKESPFLIACQKKHAGSQVLIATML